MGLFAVASVLITLAAVFSYVNSKYVRLPMVIGIMLLSLAASLATLALGQASAPFRMQVSRLVSGIEFDQAVLHGMLAFLLFAGSMQLDLTDLAREWDVIALLSLLGTAVSTCLVAVGARWVFGRLGLNVPFIGCVLFGALISPTDPIAVLAIMRKVGASKGIETQLAGESLFNDGVGVVFFFTALAVAVGKSPASAGGVTLLLVQQVLGGIGLGLACGVLTYILLRQVNQYQVEILLTLALAMGGYSLAESVQVSAPIAVVVAGLLIGNPGRSFAMSPATRENLDRFWELIDETLNAILFLLIGMQVLVTPFTREFLLAGLAAVVLTLAARYVSVAGPLAVLRLRRTFDPGAARILTWGGLRGGLSVAMALALPPSPYRNLLIAITYCVVVFSVFGQGLTAAPLIRRLDPQARGMR